MEATNLSTLWKNISSFVKPFLDGTPSPRLIWNGSSDTSHLLELPNEMLVSIISLCTLVDVKRLCETCRYLREVGIPELYYSVDLSSHKATTLCRPSSVQICTYRRNHRVPTDFVAREWISLDYQVFDKQNQFIRTVNEKPAYGKYVRELRWTVLDVNSHTWRWHVADEDDEKYLWDEEGDCDVYEPEDEPLWRTFQSFTGVLSVDICWIRSWREVAPAPLLFQTATSVRLSGCMTQEFVAKILNSSTPHIRHLELSNVLTWTATQHPPETTRHISDLSDWLYENPRLDNEQWPFFRLMNGALDPLTSKCYLTTLHIGTLGSLDEDYEDPDPNYVQLYMSWAHFLASTRSTLQVFCFDQSVNHKQYRPGGPARRNEFRSVDRLLNDYILPVLLEAVWPQMRLVELKGVEVLIFEGCIGRTTQAKAEESSDQGFEHILGRLRSMFRDDVELVIQAQAGREYEELVHEDNGVPF